MSTSFESMMQSDWAGILSSSGEFAEQITVIDPDGTTRAVWADVHRNVPATPEEFADGKIDILQVTLLNNATTGISLALFDKGRHKLRIKRRSGVSDTEDYPPGAPFAQDAATLTFRIGQKGPR